MTTLARASGPGFVVRSTTTETDPVQLIALATYPNLDVPTVDLVYRVSPGAYRIHAGVCNELPDVEGEPLDDVELVQWAALHGDSVVMVPSLDGEARS